MNRTLGMFVLVAALAGCRSKTACDAGAVQRLAEEIEAADERDRPDIVVPGITKACRLPSTFDSYFDLFDNESLTLRRMTQAEFAARAELMDRACPSAPGTLSSLSGLADPQRMPTLYDRCELDRFGVLERDDFLRAEHLPVPWMLHQFMLDNGADEASARVVTRALFTAERKQFDDEPLRKRKIELPRVDAPLREQPEGIRMEVSVDDVDVDGFAGGSLGELLVDALERERNYADLRRPGYTPTLLIYADVESSAEVVERAVGVAARLGIGYSALIVDTGAYYHGALPIAAPPEEREPPLLRVALDRAGRLELIVPKRERIDLAQLSATAATFCADGPASRFAVVEPGEGVTVAQLVEVVLALRGPACGDSIDGACCFANVGVGG